MRSAVAWMSAAVCSFAVSVALPAAASAGGDHGSPPPPAPSMGSNTGKQTPDKMERGDRETKSGKMGEMQEQQEQGGDQGADEMMSEEEADLARWPSRVLAQQAIALHRVRSDRHEAETRIHAALASKDNVDIDMDALRKAHKALDRGDIERGLYLLDAALSRPLGAETGKTLHVAGRELPSGEETQDIVGMVVGGVLILIAGGALLRGRRKPAAG